MAAVSDLAGSGGAERHFSDLFAHLRAIHPDRITFLTSRDALGRLQAAGHLRDSNAVLALPLGSRPAMTKANIAWMTVSLLWATMTRGFEVLHVVLPTPSYVPFFAVLSLLPRALRPRLVISVIDCTLAHNLDQTRIDDAYERQVVAAHRLYFTWTKLDGVFTWYEAFAEAARRLRLFPPAAIVRTARYCFTDVSRFAPSETKARVVLWVGRLSKQKRPLLFVEAVALLRQRHPQLTEGWRFEMYGRGALEGAVRSAIEAHRLTDILTLSHTPDLSPIAARSQLFVSTQAFENFTSLAMLEAMSAGNAVIAEDVGQTREYVRHGENGFVVEGGTPSAFAAGVARYLQQDELHVSMAEASRRLATTIHTVEHAANDVVEFWRGVAASP